MRSTAEAICSRMARTGRSMPGHQHHGLEAGERVARACWRGRWSASRRGRCSSPAACRAPRRRGTRRRRCGRAACAARCVTRSRMVTSPLPSMFGGRVSRRTTCSCCSCSSAASSMVTMRSSLGMNDDSTLSSVVLPVPVPPEMRMLSRASTQASQEVEPSAGVERADADQVVDRAAGRRRTCGSSATGRRARAAG